jgi:signal transduction histidine kinase
VNEHATIPPDEPARPDLTRPLAAFWAVFVALYTGRAALLRIPHQDAAFVRRCGVAVVGVGLAWLISRALEARRVRSLRSRLMIAAAACLPAGLVFATTNYAVFDILAPMPGEGCGHGLQCTFQAAAYDISDSLIAWTFVFLAWGLLCAALIGAAEAQAANAAARAAEQRAARSLEAARLAEIRALRYQINPHFLFNTLNALTALVRRSDSAEAERLIGDMGRFLRRNLAADPVADSTVAEETDLQADYLAIEARRFPDRLAVDIRVEDRAGDAVVPPLLLQPIVENVLKHAVSRTSAKVTVRISASVAAGSRLWLRVHDDAPAEAPRPRPPGLGVGLANVAQRLEARFGPSASVRAGPDPAGGFLVEIETPLERA